MSAGKCARCDKTVYPVEGLRCLDKIWHKGCFKCHECNMTLNMKNYKGFEKRPYCNAHCPQAKATTVADTPEIRRLAENTRIQSQAKYHEDFEKSRGKGFTTVLDDPEMRRIKETSKIISNVAYHGELERKKQMEEKRTIGGYDDGPAMSNNNNNNNNNNNAKHQNKMQSSNSKPHATEHMTPPHQAQQYQQQQRLLQQQHQQQHHLHHHQQQQQQHQQRQHQQQQQQQQMMMRQQQMMMRQQQQQQIIMQQQTILQQQQRHSLDPSIPMSRQTSRQAIIPNNQPQAKHLNMAQPRNQQPVKYVPVHDPMTGQYIPPHLVGVPQHMINQPVAQIQQPQQQSNRRVMNPQQQVLVQQQHHNMLNYDPNQIGSVDGIVPPNQAPFAVQPMHQPPRRVFRAMYDYVANDVDEVSFFENDILVDCVNIDRNWLVGKVARSGQTGMLPANYVAELPSQ